MSVPIVHVGIVDRPIDSASAHEFLNDPAHGAIDLFIGMVRNNHQGKSVSGISYDVHVPLAEKILKQICEEGRKFWPDTRYYVEHFRGDLKVGGVSVLVGVGGAHRAEAFDACRYVIDEIKKRVPAWKQEHYSEGQSQWLPGHSLVPEVAGSVAGIVLAGGLSSRMGRNKALMPYNGRPLVEHMAGLLRKAGCAAVHIGGAVPGFDFIPDTAPHKGPPSAMADLLRCFSGEHERLVFVPVDMPLIPVEALRCLVAHKGSAYFEGCPFPAILKTGVFGAADSVRELLAAIGAQSLPLPPVWKKGMVNVNTLEEWEKLASCI